MQKRLASCSCGQLTAEVVGEPVRISICHCLACQRRTGSVFGEQARFPREALTVGRARFHFCPTCGATVFYEIEGAGDLVGVPVGAFADPGFPTPRVSVYEERMHSWVVPPPGAERFQ